MALLCCPDCGKEYSSRLDACPKCGSPASAAAPVAVDMNATIRSRDWIKGMLLKNKYELVEKLGRGSFGQVWKSKDLESEVFVALKLLPPEMSGSPAEIARVRRNFQQVHALHHQNIMAHLAMFQYGDDCALVMELVDGLTLGEYRLRYEEEHGTFPLDEALRICRQIAEALDFAHSRKVAHRDVKPANIMVTPEGDVKLLDFGLAAEIKSSMSRVSKQVFDTAGTRPYMAPEQWNGDPPDAASDQYALGVVLYELLSGHPPFESPEPIVLMNCALRETPKELASLTPSQNRALLRSLSKTPEERFPDCLALVDAFEQPAESAIVVQTTKAPAVETAQILIKRKYSPQAPHMTLDCGNGVQLELARIHAGTFMMGSPPSERGRKDDEIYHEVTLNKPFFMGIHEVTQTQYQAVMGANPSQFIGDNLPVETVSWEYAYEFCYKLSERIGRRVRLPTESEWEYSCRAGTATPFYFGTTITTEQANYNSNGIYGNGLKGTYRQKTTPVGSFPPNAWGLYDMHGNVWEWCSNWYEYPQDFVTDPQSIASGAHRVCRGGSWSNIPYACRSARRFGMELGGRGSRVGFRIALDN